jgi:hypothetical protein
MDAASKSCGIQPNIHQHTPALWIPQCSFYSRDITRRCGLGRMLAITRLAWGGCWTETVCEGTDGAFTTAALKTRIFPSSYERNRHWRCWFAAYTKLSWNMLQCLEINFPLCEHFTVDVKLLDEHWVRIKHQFKKDWKAKAVTVHN